MLAYGGLTVHLAFALTRGAALTGRIHAGLAAARCRRGGRGHQPSSQRVSLRRCGLRVRKAPRIVDHTRYVTRTFAPCHVAVRTLHELQCSYLSLGIPSFSLSSSAGPHNSLVAVPGGVGPMTVAMLLLNTLQVYGADR